jgi:two-component sensor histidine kinase
MRIPQPPDEAQRLAALEALDILDTPPEAAFDEIAGFAARICAAPVALVSLVDRERQWFKARLGVDDLTETPRSQAICSHAIAADSYLEIPDTTADPRTATNPIVTGPPHFRFYAGALLRTREGAALGTLCVLDHAARSLTAFQREALEFLAGQVVRQFELRRALDFEETLRAEIDHRVKNSLQAVASVLRIQRTRAADPAASDAIAAAERRIETISLVHNALYQTEQAETLALEAFLPRLADLLAAALPDRIRISADVAPARLPAGQARALAMIASEFAANAARHAFGSGDAGEVRIDGRQTGKGYTVTFSDNGRGMTGDAAGSGSGIGLQIISASAEQIGADPVWAPGPDGRGTTLTLALPAPGG